MKKTLVIMSVLMCIMLFFAGCTKKKVDYPVRDVQVVVPYGAGGDTDIIGRAVMAQVKKALGVSVVVTNIKGAGGTTATTEVYNATPDGYTALWMQPNMVLNYVTGITDLSFEDFKGFAICVQTQASVLGVSADSPYNNINDLIADMKANPGKIIYATQVGSYTHTVSLAIESVSGSTFKKVDVGGGANQIAAVLGGHADLCVVEAGVMKDYITSGEIKPLCNLSDKRSSFMPDLSTAKEQGVELPIAFKKIFFTCFPPETPDDVIATFNAAVKKATKTQELKDSLAGLYAETMYMDGDEAIQYLKDLQDYYLTMQDKLQNDVF